MRTLFLAVFLAASAGAAAAEPWTDPTGRYTLDFAQNRWVSVPPRAANYLEIVSTSALAHEIFLSCGARVYAPVEGTTGFDQSWANAVSRRFGIANLRNAVPDAQDARVEHTVIDGVEVVELRFTQPSPHSGLHHHWRTFYLATPEGIVQHQLICGGAIPARPEDYADIDNVLSTLRFLSTD